MKKPITRNLQTLAESRLFKLESMEVEFGNGEVRQYERVAGRRPIKAVMIAAINERNEVLMVREYAAALQRYEIYFPKGGVDAGESITDAANRELQEETGFAARELSHLKTLSMSPAYLAHETSLVLAQDLYPSPLPGDEPEPLELIHWSLDKVAELITHPECTESRTLAALLILNHQT